MSEVFAGINYLVKGIEALHQATIRPFIIIPLIINIIISIFLYLIIYYYTQQVNQWLIQHLPYGLKWLHFLLIPIVSLIFIVVNSYGFVMVGNIIAAPFNAVLAERVIQQQLPQRTLQQQSFWQHVGGFLKSILRQIKILSYYAGWCLGILCLFLIPFIQLLAPMLWIMFSAWFLMLTYLDYASETFNVSWLELRRFAAKKRWLCWSFGLASLFLATLPIVNLIVIPASVIGATLLWLENYDGEAHA